MKFNNIHIISISGCLFLTVSGYILGRKIAFIDTVRFLERSLVEDRDFEYFGVKTRAKDYLFTSIEGLFFSPITGFLFFVILCLLIFLGWRCLVISQKSPDK